MEIHGGAPNRMSLGIVGNLAGGAIEAVEGGLVFELQQAALAPEACGDLLHQEPVSYTHL